MTECEYEYMSDFQSLNNGVVTLSCVESQVCACVSESLDNGVVVLSWVDD